MAGHLAARAHRVKASGDPWPSRIHAIGASYQDFLN